MKNELAISRYMLSSMLRDLQMIQATFEKYGAPDLGQGEREHLTSAIVHITMVCSKLRALEGIDHDS